MRPYFGKMTPFGTSLTDREKEGAKEGVAEIRRVEEGCM